MGNKVACLEERQDDEEGADSLGHKLAGALRVHHHQLEHNRRKDTFDIQRGMGKGRMSDRGVGWDGQVTT